MKNKSFIDSISNFLKSFFDDKNFLRDNLTPVHPAGYPFILIFCISALLIGALSDFLGWLGLIITAWCVYFFRDPIRISPKEDSLIVSPADGRILDIKKATPPDELGHNKEMTKVSIFMNVFNVHVNRIPVSGKIVDLKYEPGSFFNASFDKASKYNERMSVKLNLKNNVDVFFVQIAGLIARRIKCDLKLNQTVKSGEKYGIIRFGSRVDLYLPTNFTINILKGQTMIGGETVIANIPKNSKKISSEREKIPKKVRNSSKAKTISKK